MDRYSVFLPFLSLLVGCSCEHILYQGSLNLMFVPAISAPGEVEIELLGDINDLCSFTLPLDPGAVTLCVTDPSVIDVDGVSDIGVFPTEDGLSAAGLDFGPSVAEHFSLAIYHDGELLYEGEQEPEYTVTDHGRGSCKQTAQSSVVEIAVPEPQG